MIQSLFKKFYENITLTQAQREDAITKYREVCKKLHSAYYDTEDYKKTRFLFGSYKKKTAIRPITENQDIDVLFKMPPEKFNEYNDNISNPQSQLLQDIRNILKEKYPISEKVKAWGKVILVKTADGKHNIELLPAWQKEDGSFTIPNSKNAGSWESFDPRKEIKRFSNSNKRTNGLTRKLSKMIKKWAREVTSLSIKSCEIEDLVINFLDYEDYADLPFSYLIHNFFNFLYEHVSVEDKNYAKTALDRTQEAIRYEQDRKYKQASREWRKVFGREFPIYKHTREEPRAENEQFIEELINVDTNNTHFLKIDAEVQQNSFMKKTLTEYVNKHLPLKKEKKLRFFIVKTDVAKPYSVKWKVRNFGFEAERKGNLRGEIWEDEGFYTKKEYTKYQGEHFVECYIIKDGICVARDKIIVPIGLN